ncbi:MAG: glycoside hydrolase family 32 protein [Planctomycetaceae bacterium]
MRVLAGGVTGSPMAWVWCHRVTGAAVMMRGGWCSVLVAVMAVLLRVCVSGAGAVAAAEDLVLADFEGETYGEWQVTGAAFGSGPARGALPGQMSVEGFAGGGLVNSFFGGDDATGTLTSPAFRIERRYLSFLIGGGRSEKLGVQLLVNGRVVRSATGSNDVPGGSEQLTVESFELGDLAGQMAVLRVLDAAQGSWGHINVDQIVQTDVRPRGYLTNVERTFTAGSRYLQIPVRNGAAKRVVTLLVDGEPVVRNDIELADGAADWWAPLDISGWRDRQLTLRVDRLHEESAALQNVGETDELRDAGDLYAEPLRGQFHFSPRRGWNNDPNGCVYFNGEYHLFFQHNPYGWSWGNMHWGHAVSRDLVHWEELGDVLQPDELGPMFSGSAVVDWKNTSGFGEGGRPPLVLIYTAAGSPTVQCLAYSTDGRKFVKYSGNPVLGQVTGGNRDPKVFWHAGTSQWVMVLYVEQAGVHTVHFFTSANLREWHLASVTEGDGGGGRYLFECPDLFELSVGGDAAQRRWVLLGANSEYGVGGFDGVRFAAEQQRLAGQRGRGFYAAQSFSDVPDGRRILIGWWQTETRGMPFNQSMTVPLELGLRETMEGVRLTFAPVRELLSLRGGVHSLGELSLRPGMRNPLEGMFIILSVIFIIFIILFIIILLIIILFIIILFMPLHLHTGQHEQRSLHEPPCSRMLASFVRRSARPSP